MLKNAEQIVAEVNHLEGQLLSLQKLCRHGADREHFSLTYRISGAIEVLRSVKVDAEDAIREAKKD